MRHVLCGSVSLGQISYWLVLFLRDISGYVYLHRSNITETFGLGYRLRGAWIQTLHASRFVKMQPHLLGLWTLCQDWQWQKTSFVPPTQLFNCIEIIFPASRGSVIGIQSSGAPFHIHILNIRQFQMEVNPKLCLHCWPYSNFRVCPNSRTVAPVAVIPPSPLSVLLLCSLPSWGQCVRKQPLCKWLELKSPSPNRQCDQLRAMLVMPSCQLPCFW